MLDLSPACHTMQWWGAGGGGGVTERGLLLPGLQHRSIRAEHLLYTLEPIAFGPLMLLQLCTDNYTCCIAVTTYRVQRRSKGMQA